MRLFTPARTSASATSCALSAGTVEHGDLDAQVAHDLLHARGVEAAAAVHGGVGELGSMSKAATMATDGLSSAKWASTARPRLPTPTRATSWRAGPSRKAADAVDAGVDVVALVGAARVADDHEVAAHLGRAHDGVAGELVRVDAARRRRRGGTRAAAGSGSCARRSSSIPRRLPTAPQRDHGSSLQNERCEICHDCLRPGSPCQHGAAWTGWPNGGPEHVLRVSRWPCQALPVRRTVAPSHGG